MKICRRHPDLVGQSRAHLLGMQPFRLSFVGAYNVTRPGIYKSEPPHYSMTANHEMPGDGTKKPGPGKYSPEKVWLHKQQAPGYSFGIRHSMYEAPLIVEVKD